MAKHSQTTPGQSRADVWQPAQPGEDPGTLMDEEYLSDGGPDAVDAAVPSPDARRDDRTDDSIGAQPEAHSDSPPQTRRAAVGEDPERAGPVDPD